MKSPVKKIFITQKFGANPDAYAKFGLKGHNGLDYRAFLPNGDRCYEGGKSEVFAPHDGKIIENALDSNGYGNYIKIENDKEGSVMGHFSSKSPKAVGSTVKEGEFVGYQGTTGNSTGIHLHWGYYKFPRDRQNGYGGFINQEGLYEPWGATMMYKGLDLTNQESMKVAVDVWYEVVTKKLYIKLADIYARYEVASLDELDSRLSGLKSRISDLTKQLGVALGEQKNREEQVERLKVEIAKNYSEKLDLLINLKTAEENYEKASKEKAPLVNEIEQLKIQVETLKQQNTEGKVTLTIAELFKLLWNQKIIISK
jgi:hypothetical protein